MRTQSGVRTSDVLAALCMFVLIFIAAVAPAAAQTRTFTVVNNCSETVWAAGAGDPTPVFNGTDSGGIELTPGASATATVPTPWSSARIWGRRECNFNSSGQGSCATGDCGQLHCTHAGAGNTTLTEWTLTGSDTGSDNYDISLVDAFDFPISIQLDDPNPSHCINSACQVDLRNYCPPDMQNFDSSGNVVGCKSMCGKTSTPNYCCAGPYGAPESCNNVNWDTNYRGIAVKRYCSSVYGYAYDDPSSDFNCTPPPTTGYTITFCPNSTVPNANPIADPQFTITASNNPQTVKPGNAVTYDMDVTASGSFSGTVTLSAAHVPGSCTWATSGAATCGTAGASASFSPSSVTLSAGETVPVTMTISTTASPAPMLGTFNVEAIGHSGALENVWEGSLTVADSTAADYTLAVTPTGPQTIAPGGSITYNMTLTPLNGFTGTVNFLSYGTPAGTVTFTPASVTFGTGQQTATFKISSSSSATPKSYFPLITTFSTNRLHDFQSELTLATTACTAPSAPTGFNATANSNSQITLSWTPSSGSSPCVASYNVYRSTTSGFTASSSNLIAYDVPGPTYVDPGLQAATTYYYLVVAMNSGGLSGSSSQASATTSGTSSCSAAPTAPTGVTATAVSSSQINLSWTASTAPAGCVITYNVYRSTTNGFTPSSSNQIASGVSTTSFSDTGLAASTTYYYLVEAVDSAGSSGSSNQASATTQTSGCTAAPTAPNGLTATAQSSSQINLSWTASTAGTGCTITYSVFRSTTSGFTPSSSNQIASGVTTTSYSDTGLAASTTYYYLVEGVDSAGSSSASNQASATTSASSGSCTSICIDSGSTTAVSPFVADEDFTGGTTIDHKNNINTSKVTNPAPAAVYQTARVGNFTYTIGGFTAGSSHNVRLHFCETYFTASGKRTFNVSVNGATVLTDFDIFAAAGGQNIADIQQFTENANSSGQYVIVFTEVINQSLISGIEID